MQKKSLFFLSSLFLLLNSCGERLTIAPTAFINNRWDLANLDRANPSESDILFWSQVLDPDGGFHCPHISRPCWLPSNPQCGLCPEMKGNDRLDESCTCPDANATPCDVSFSPGCCGCPNVNDITTECCARSEICTNDPADVEDVLSGIFLTNFLAATIEASQDGNQLRIVLTWHRPNLACDRCETCLDVFAPFENRSPLASSPSVLLNGEIEPAPDINQIVPFLVQGEFSTPISQFRWQLVMSGEISQEVIRGQLEITDLICDCTDVFTFDFKQT